MSRFWMWAALAFVTFMALSAVASAQTRGGVAVLRGLDKVTGHARDFNAPLGQAVAFGTLEVVARACVKRPEEETPEVSVYVEIFDTAPSVRRSERGEGEERRQIFSGWMFASSPGLNALEHPVYDVWAMDCRS
jgi:hypothetical protein